MRAVKVTGAQPRGATGYQLYEGGISSSNSLRHCKHFAGCSPSTGTQSLAYCNKLPVGGTKHIEGELPLYILHEAGLMVAQSPD